MLKWTKRIAIITVAAAVAGGIVFGTGFPSYVRSSGRALSKHVRTSIPIEFEIQRARDLLEELVPELHANLRLVAAEEVEVAGLDKEIEAQRRSVERERGDIVRLRKELKTRQASYDFGHRHFTRAEVVDELARRFERLQSAERLLEGKEGLLRNRQRSLDAALQKLEKTRLARVDLAAQIEGLEAQFRLVQAQSSGGEFALDDSKLAQTERLISGLKKRLEVAQRVLAREARFIELIPLDHVSEDHVVERVDAYLDEQSSLVAESASSDRS